MTSLLSPLTASPSPWEWHPHPDVWLLVGGLSVGYWWALTRLGPRHVPAGQPTATRRQVASWTAGVLAVWFFADWPVHDLSEEYLFSVHMVQHMVFTLVAPGLLFVGLPAWLLRLLVRPRPIGGVLRAVARPLPAALAFNTAVVVTHWPAAVDLALRREVVHFAVHVVIFATALLMWIPVLNRLPELPRIRSAPARMIYLFLQSIVPTVPASFITFAESPLYEVYARAPRLVGLSAVEDQQLAGAIMKLGGGAILWGVIIVLFFRWYADEQRNHDVLTWDDVETELRRTRPRAAG